MVPLPTLGSLGHVGELLARILEASLGRLTDLLRGGPWKSLAFRSVLHVLCLGVLEKNFWFRQVPSVFLRDFLRFREGSLKLSRCFWGSLRSP